MHRHPHRPLPLIARQLLLLLCCLPVASWAQDPAPRLTVLTIADNIYTVGSTSPHDEHPVSGDAHFIVTKAGVVLIDTGSTLAFGQELKKLIRTVTPQPVRKIIYTHWHWDHVLGGPAFAEPGVEIIAQENVLKNFQALWPLALTQARLGIFGYRGGFPDRPSPLPTRTFRDKLRLSLGDHEIILYATQGETDDQAFVHLPKQGVLFVGDHFNPMLGHPLSPEGTLEGFVQGLELIERLAPQRIVHGHGEFALMTPSLAALQPLKEVSRSILAQVRTLTAEGFDLEQTQQRVLLPPPLNQDAFARVVFKFVREPFVNRLHRQLTGYYGSSAVAYAPAPKAQMAQIWLKLAGGADAVLNTASTLIEQGEHQAALELLDVVLTDNAQQVRALNLQADAYEQLASQVGLSNFFRYYSYLAAAAKLRLRTAGAASP